jgi:hypothetical protein
MQPNLKPAASSASSPCTTPSNDLLLQQQLGVMLAPKAGFGPVISQSSTVVAHHEREGDFGASGSIRCVA